MKSKIITRNIHPPIPIRKYDWLAYRDGTEDLEAGIVGYGETEREAINNLLELESA